MLGWVSKGGKGERGEGRGVLWALGVLVVAIMTVGVNWLHVS